MNNKFKVGDKIVCRDNSGLSSIGIDMFYTVLGTRLYSYDAYVSIINDNGNRIDYLARRFELVNESPSLLEQINLAKKFLGKRGSSGVKYNGWSVFTVSDFDSKVMKDVYGEKNIKEHLDKVGFYVGIFNRELKVGVNVLDFEEYKEESMQLTHDYKATVDSKGITVGCQHITFEKLDELNEIVKGFR